jgi:hypothetical protein
VGVGAKIVRGLPEVGFQLFDVLQVVHGARQEVSVAPKARSGKSAIASH